MKLNIEKIKDELTRIRQDRKWLAKQLGVSAVMICYIYKTKPITYAEKIAKVFKISPKDLLI